MIKELMNNPWAWGVLSVITILSFLYAVYCQQKNKEKKEISYAQKSTVLVQNKKSKYQKLSLCYDRDSVDNICVSRFAIWNSGNKVLQTTDMAKSKEIKITLAKEKKILEASIIASTDETNKFSVNVQDENTIIIPFDYIESKDGVVVQIIHTGLNNDLAISCKIKGGKSLYKYDNSLKLLSIFTPNSKSKLSSALTFIAMTIVYTFTSLRSILQILVEKKIVTESHLASFFNQRLENSTNSLSHDSGWFTIILLILTIIFMIIADYEIIKNQFYVGIPSKLKDEFLEN